MAEEDRWRRVDDALFAGRRVEAMKLATEDVDVPLRDAIELVGQRFEMLVERSRERFTVPLHGYWSGFYS